MKITEDISHKPYIFWAFTTMKAMLQTSRNCDLANTLDHVADVLRLLHSPDSSLYDPLEELSTPEMMTQLIKIANMSANTSLNYCVFSICNALLNRTNREIATVHALLHDPHAQFKLQVLTDTDSSVGSLPIVPLLRQWEKQLLHQASGFYNAYTFMIFPQASKSSSHDSPFKQHPNHTLGGFSTEYKLLRLCSGRLLTESAHYRLNSRFTREVFQFLSEANTLRRHLCNLEKTKDPLRVVTGSVLHEDIVNDWRVACSVNHTAAGISGNTPAFNAEVSHLLRPSENAALATDAPSPSSPKESKKVSTFLRGSAAGGSTNSSVDPSATKMASPAAAAPAPTLSVAHVTATSLVITWANVPEDEDWNSAVQRAAVAASASSTATGAPSAPIPQSTNSSGLSLSASVGGLLASIKGTVSYSQPNHTSFSLYITPIYRTFGDSTGSSQTSQAKSAPQEGETSLVMPFITPHGTHKVDSLDPGECSPQPPRFGAVITDMHVL
jgi:hypothetical protein